jgi:multimeric flavodoxin WrbA
VFSGAFFLIAIPTSIIYICDKLRQIATFHPGVDMARILGISGSLRNARVSSSSSLCDDLCKVQTKEELVAYLDQQGKVLVESYLEAGSASDDSYLEVYEKLRRMAKDQGLSNSESALACGLWAAAQDRCEIDCVSLARHFPPAGEVRHGDDLKAKILLCDGLLVSGPVYFGDRGSLVQSLIDFCSQDQEIVSHLEGKVYAGISVGAKRNGGQETTLIYQMLDMANMGMLSVGNDTQTTSQYGGTAVAGDIGKLTSDNYGIDTCISTGHRIAHVAKLEESSRSVLVSPKVKINMLVLQDSKDRKGLEYFQQWALSMSAQFPDSEILLWDVLSETVVRCIGCDICPIDVGEAEKYRCIISRKDDFFAANHESIVDADAMLICAYSPESRADQISLYQQYMERTRYIRRDNYLYSDLLVAPFVISELAARQNMHMRIMTSMVRHQTIISHPLIGMIHNGVYINEGSVEKHSKKFIESAAKVVKGRINNHDELDNLYNPVGYVISKKKNDDDKKSGRLDEYVTSAKASRKKKQQARMD